MEALTLDQLKELHPDLVQEIEMNKEIRENGLLSIVRKRINQKNRKFKVVSGKDFKLRASKSGVFISEPKSKSPKKIYYDACESYEKHLQYEKTQKEKIDKLELEVKEGSVKSDAKCESWQTKFDEAENKELATVKKLLSQIANEQKRWTESKNKKLQKIQEEKKKLNEMNAVTGSKLLERQNAFENKDKIVLTVGQKSYLREWLKEAQTGRRKTYSTFGTRKGTLQEDESILLYNEVTGCVGVKNEKRLTNEWFTGEFDYMPENVINLIVDIKSSQDDKSHPRYYDELPSDNKVPTKAYYTQPMIYINLADEHGLIENIEEAKCEIAYCLVNATDEMIEDEIKKQCRYNKVKKLSLEEEEKIYYNMTFDNIPKELRVKRYIFQYQPDIIETLKKKVEAGREYIDNVLLKSSMTLEL